MSTSAGRRVVTDPRISRRRNAVARSKRRRAASITAVVVATGALGWGALASPLLAVDQIRVVGGRHTTADDIARATGLGSDDNLLLLSTHEVEQRAETLPWVKEAEVDRMLPGTVRIRVVERTPALVLSLGAATWTIDARGNVLDSGATSEDLPHLGGAEVGDVEIGARLTTPEVQHALRAFRSLSKKLRGAIVAVVAPTFERISFSLSDGTLIRFGAAEQVRAKNEVLNALLRRLQREGRAATYIDVRVPTSPAVAPRTISVTPAASPTA